MKKVQGGSRYEVKKFQYGDFYIDKITFIIDCDFCKAKVAAIQINYDTYEDLQEVDEETAYPFYVRLYLGRCPQCEKLLVGKSENFNYDINGYKENGWTSIVRVYPNPPKTFLSYNIPEIVKISFKEAELALQCDAKMAACIMLGRTLEAICRNVIQKYSDKLGDDKDKSLLKNQNMLHQGISKLREMKIIDERLYNWSQQLRAYRNIAAHAVDIKITRKDVEDLKIFVQAMIEYIYDLTELYEEFMSRTEKYN